MGETAFIVGLIIFNILFIAFIAAIVAFIRQYKIKKKAHEKEVLDIEEEHKKELLETQLEIQSQTMINIGREIHDNVGQKLTLVSLYVQQIEYENKTPKINNKIKNVSNIINQSLHDLRQLSKTLTDNNIANNALVDLLKKECQTIRELKYCHIHFTNNEIEPKSYHVKSVLFRITQEFIQNSIKHSKCSNIYISLNETDTLFSLLLKDDGIGFQTDAKFKGIGLKNIKKRTELIGGEFTLESDKQSGTKLTINLSIK